MAFSEHTDLLDTICQHWQSLGVHTDFDALQTVGRLLRLSKTIDMALAQLHKEYGLKLGDFDVLAALKRNGTNGLTPSQLYQTILLSSGAMTSKLDRLQQKDLIRRQHCQQDRRSIKVFLTAKGQDIVDLVYPAHFELISQLLASQPADNKKQLAQLLKQWLVTVEAKGSPFL